MKKIDISILEKRPILDVNVKMEIEPVGALSMCADFPGSYYKTLMSPNKKMFCGFIENVIGWHFDEKIRKLVLSDLKKLRKLQKLPFINYQKGSTYIPLLMDFFKITNVDIPEFVHFDDLWNRFHRRPDTSNHAKGTKNLDYTLIPQLNNLRDENGKISDDDYQTHFITNKDKYPSFYSIPTKREYIYTEGKYIFDIEMHKDLYLLLKYAEEWNNTGYLGNSEGRVHFKIDLV